MRARRAEAAGAARQLLCRAARQVAAKRPFQAQARAFATHASSVLHAAGRKAPQPRSPHNSDQRPAQQKGGAGGAWASRQGADGAWTGCCLWRTRGRCTPAKRQRQLSHARGWRQAARGRQRRHRCLRAAGLALPLACSPPCAAVPSSHQVERLPATACRSERVSATTNCSSAAPWRRQHRPLSQRRRPQV